MQRRRFCVEELNYLDTMDPQHNRSKTTFPRGTNAHGKGCLAGSFKLLGGPDS